MLGLGCLAFFLLAIFTLAFAGVLSVMDCDCVAAGRLMYFAAGFGVASNLCFFAGVATATPHQRCKNKYLF